MSEIPERRPIYRRRRVALGAAVLSTTTLITGIAWSVDSSPKASAPPPGTTYLADRDRQVATIAALEELAKLHGTFQSASVKLTKNNGEASNTGYNCTSDHVLRLRLIGQWGMLLGGGLAGQPELPQGPWQAAEDVVDRDTGRVCLKGLIVGADVAPAPGSTILFGRGPEGSP